MTKRMTGSGGSGRAYTGNQGSGTRGFSSNDPGLRPEPKVRGAFSKGQRVWAPFDDGLAKTDYRKVWRDKDGNDRNGYKD
jgi:hypothetical protein